MTTKTKQKKHLSDLHFEHKLWTSELKFYTDELKIYQNRLEEVASKNNSEPVRKQVDHFQNSFIIQKEQIDIISHEVVVHEQKLEKFAKNNPVAIDHHLFGNHESMEDSVKIFKKIYSELKQEFLRFLSTWM